MASVNQPPQPAAVVEDLVEVKAVSETPEIFYVVKVLVHECLSDHNLAHKGDGAHLEVFYKELLSQAVQKAAGQSASA